MRRVPAALILTALLGCSSGDAPSTSTADAGVDTDEQLDGDARPIFAPSCEDELKNGDESDIDCGGSNCGRCGPGKGCNTAADCSGGKCLEGTCVPIASSCRELHEIVPKLKSGNYEMRLADTTINPYCDMTNDGGGWALAFKVDGGSSTWAYANAVWANDTEFGTNDTTLGDAKLAPYLLMPFTELRVVMRDAEKDRSLVLTPAKLPVGATLRSVFASGTYYATTAPRAGWLGLVASGSLQTQCQQQGLNNNVPGQGMRIGIFGNQEMDCLTCDSRLGIGHSVAPASCNIATAAHDDSGAGARTTTTFALVYVR